MTVNEPNKVDQTIFASDPEKPGNCFAACVASALGLDLNQVPHFMHFGEATYGDDRLKGDHWHAMFLGFLAGQGVWPVSLDKILDAEVGEVVFVSGPSLRGVPHQVLYRYGRLWHDPHPSRAGLVSVDDGDFFVLRPLPDAGFDHGPTGAGE